MLLGRPWLRDAKISHNWGTNIVTIQGTNILITIFVTKKLGVQTNKLEVLVCYDFQYGISNEEEDVMFTIELNMFYVGIIVESTHTELVSKSICIPNFTITKPIPKHVELVCHNLNLGLAIKARACKGAGQEGSPRVTSHALGNVGE